jgi:hypothetical protein
MNEKLEQVKKHLEENKKIYVASALTAVGTAAIFLVVGKTNRSLMNNQQVSQIACWKPRSTQVIMNFTERSTPSKPVHLVGTDLYFDSLSDAARKTGHHLSDISKVINGHKTDIQGDVFELLQAA